MHESKQNQETNNEEVLDFSKPDFTFIPKGRHEWKQQGYYIICKTCDIEHAVWIGSKMLLVGIEDNGNALLKRRKDVYGNQ